MKTKQTRQAGGFTLVEIMIVVAIIALLAAIAVPSFLRARKRSQATASLETLRMIDGAKDQYAIENGKNPGVTPGGTDLAVYVKKGTKLYNDLTNSPFIPLDALNAQISINGIDTAPQINASTKTSLQDALGGTTATANAFFGAYQ